MKSSGVLFERGAKKLGLHPQPSPLAILSRPYRGRAACVHCGFCLAFGCEVGAKSSTLATVIPVYLLLFGDTGGVVGGLRQQILQRGSALIETSEQALALLFTLPFYVLIVALLALYGYTLAQPTLSARQRDRLPRNRADAESRRRHGRVRAPCRAPGSARASR